MMKTLYALSKRKHSTFLRLSVLLFCTLCFACGKDKNTPKEPAMGYFVKTIQLALEEVEMKFEMQYDEQNRLVREDVKLGTDDISLQYEYNSAGQLTKVWWDDKLYGTFEYEGKLLAKIIVPANGSDPERTYPVTYTDGIYQAMDGSIHFTIDEKQQLLYSESVKARYTYTNKPGVHRYLSPQPVWFIGDIGSFTFYSLLVSQQEIAKVDLRGDVHEVRNKRDAQGNITQVDMVEETTGRIGSTWKITYEQRVLVE